MSDRPVRRLPDPGAVHDEREIEAVVEVLRSSNLTIGPKVAACESAIAVLLAKRRGVMVNSGSSALKLAVELLALEPGDEIITAAVTFGTDIAPIVQAGLVPVFVDVDPTTYQVDAARIEEMVGPRTRAILMPNLVGNCPDWDAIRSVADAHDLVVIEDSCDVLDSWQRGRRTGERADISVTSFARGHAITAAGNGGMVGVNTDDQLDRCLMLRRWGRRSEAYLFGSRQGERDRHGPLADGTPYDLTFQFEMIGYNFEPSEIGAAYALVQLEKLTEYNGRRQHNWNRLHELMAEHEELLERPGTEPDTHTTWMRYPFLLREGVDRAALQRALVERGIASFMVWSGNILRHPAYAAIERREPRDGLPNADAITERALSLPAHHALSSDDLGYMVEVVGEELARLSP
ncbi:MAG: DegT/DnrJ/EryC1/StrS family aminotransferase [Acidimicrobiia bacterium]|nr:DegT/DnrJ/EryC1/StrS family aminotransferase [Acidimicrobiia bacterium]